MENSIIKALRLALIADVGCTLTAQQCEWILDTLALQDEAIANRDMQLGIMRDAIHYTLSSIEYMRMLWGGEGVTDGIAARLREALEATDE